MTYEEALSYIHSKLRFGSKPGLSRILELCEKLKNPQDSLKFIHIAGTNGKGSTTAFISSILKQAGYKTGMYISPFITDFRERISINGEFIPKDWLANITEMIMPIAESMEESPTEFELVTAIAFLYYKEMQCDFVVLETGLGGRFDATNIIKAPLCSVITKISFDHTEYLGNTLEKIAFEKCGIIKKGGITITYPNQDERALAVIASRAKEEDNSLIIPETPSISRSGIDGLNISYKGMDINIPLPGIHQAYNCVTALEAVLALKSKYSFWLNNDDIIKGIADTRFPARLEILSKEPLIILDGAHNLDGITALCENIDTFLKGRDIHIIMGMLRDKDYEECVSLIAPKCKSFTAVTPMNARALLASELYESAKLYCSDVNYFDEYKEAVDFAVKKADRNGVVLICGSLYMAGKMREIFFTKSGSMS